MMVIVESIEEISGDLLCRILDDGGRQSAHALCVDPFVTGAVAESDVDEFRNTAIGKVFEMEDNPQAFLVLPQIFKEVAK